MEQPRCPVQGGSRRTGKKAQAHGTGSLLVLPMDIGFRFNYIFFYQLKICLSPKKSVFWEKLFLGELFTEISTK